MERKQVSYRFHRMMLTITITVFVVLLFPSICNGVLFRRTSTKRVLSKTNIILQQPPQKDLPTENSISPIFSKPTLRHEKCLEKNGSKYSRRRCSKTMGSHVEVNRFSEFRKTAFLGEELSNTISNELKPVEIRSKLTNDVVELFFNELFRGLLDCNSMIPTMPSFGGALSNTVPVRGFLVDVSMSMWLALQNYFRYKQRSNWQCDEDNCVLMDAPTPTQPDSVSVDGGEPHSLLLSSGTVVSYLIPLEAAAPPTALPSGLVDAGSSIMLPPDECGGAVASEAGPLQSMPATSAPLASPVAVAKYCATSLLIHLLSHQVAPFVMHSIEDCLGQLAVAVA